MNFQEAFDIVWQRFVLEGNAKASSPTLGCIYSPLPKEGNYCGCAIGCLLSPEIPAQLDKMGGGTWTSVQIKLDDCREYKSLSQLLKSTFEDPNNRFWTELQLCHDSTLLTQNFTEQITESLTALAKKYNLIIPGAK